MTFRVTVTKEQVVAGVVAAYTSRAVNLAKRATFKETQKFLRVAHNTRSAGRGPVIIIDPPQPYPSRIVRRYDPRTLVLLKVICRMYLNMTVTAR